MTPPRRHSRKNRTGKKPKYRKRQQAKKNAAHTTSPAPPPTAQVMSLKPSLVVSLDPLAPIVVRSGRPFDAQAGVDPARFPPPSTVAGCLRTAWARQNNQSFGLHLAQCSVAGPLLLTRKGQVLAPKPADALYFGHGASARCVRAEPLAFGGGCDADLPEGLLPVQLTRSTVGKPGPGPAWWSWDDLLSFRSGNAVVHTDLCHNGWSPPPGDRRTHVAIDPSTGGAKEGQLFQTEGLDLDVSEAPSNGSSAGGLRLLVRFDQGLGATLVHLGGERRLAALQPEPVGTWPTPPQGWLDEIAAAGGLCLTLLTPGVFSCGYRPGWLNAALTGVPPDAPNLRLELRAVAVDRWQPHSGWDLVSRQPRPSRKLAPAGTTYWFSILDGADTAALEALWLASVCDLCQDRRDGFGLALPSPWTPPP